jgi:hypothetical protein
MGDFGTSLGLHTDFLGSHICEIKKYFQNFGFCEFSGKNRFPPFFGQKGGFSGRFYDHLSSNWV